MGKEKWTEKDTPVNVLWDNILMIPVFGNIDSKRAQDIMESMLKKIVETDSQTIILDILGVPTVDSAVANHIIKITRATKLIGCDAIVSGLSPEIAQTLVNLGVDLGEINTTATLAKALKLAFKMMGFEVRKV